MRYRSFLAVLLVAGCGGSGGGNEGQVTTTVVARFAYVANMVTGSAAGGGELSAFTIDASTGKLRHNGYAAVASGGGLTSVAVSPSNTLVYATNSSGVWGFKIDPASGTLSPIAGSPFSDGQANPKSV